MSTARTTIDPPPTLVPEFTLTVNVKPPVQIGAGPFGIRMYSEITGGRAQGERINADLASGGGDWLLVGPDGFGRLDVRVVIHTDDGATVYVQYPGLISLNEAVTTALATGGTTQFEDQYFRATPQFETGDERYKWLQQNVFVSEGRVLDGGIQYRVHRVD
jgi:hypothetical protein